MLHLIRTQVIDVVIPSEEEVFVLQQRLRDVFYQVILPMIERAFDEICTADEVIYLDRLEIDLGKLSLKDLGSLNLTEKFREKITEQITAIILSPHKKKKSKLSLRMGIARQWMYYMQHGFLPWNTIATDAVWYQQVLEGFACDSVSIDTLRILISSDASAVKRMVLLNTPDFLLHLTEALTSEKQTDLALAIASVQKVLAEAGKQNESTRFGRVVWEEILYYTSKEPNLTSDKIMRLILPRHLNEGDIPLLNKHKYEAPDLIEPVITSKDLSGRLPEITLHAREKRPSNPEPASKSKNKIPDEGLFVPHTGLTLLHPFLFNLFNFLGLLDGKHFKSILDQQKALAALYFLSTGSTTFEEHELVIAKILCNYSLEELVDPEIKLSIQEQGECEALLQEVIGRWSILKSTSVDTLRTTFLQRSGKLFTIGEEPHLLIEPNVLDVLLDHIPWSINIIRLPWMKHLLKVEWR